jgi:monoterpene epsilon-lactone hydrolase
LVKGLFRNKYPDEDAPGPYRRALDETARLFTIPENLVLRPDTIAGVPAEWIGPSNARSDVLLLYLHGGGYYMGGIASYRHYVARVAQITGLRTVHIEYRLAPEHPFPAAIDDATAVFKALAKNTVPADRIVIAGDSAGGGLTLATLLAVRDAGHALPKAAAAIAPWTDLTFSGASIETHRHRDPVLGRMQTRSHAGWYAGDTPRDHPLVSPLFADLTGLPPLLIQIGTEDILFDDAIRLADRAKQQRADLELEIWDGMVHVWHYYAEWIPEGRDAIRRIGEFFSQHLDLG